MAAPVSSSNTVSNPLSPASHFFLPKTEPPQDVSKQPEGSEELSKESIEDPIDIMESKEYMEKLQKYEADYKQYLMSKYFTDKTIFGGNIFDVKLSIDGQTTTASRLPPYQSYLDPACFNEMNNKESTPLPETSAGGDLNGKVSI